MEDLINQSYQLSKKLGSGAFGEIFEGVNIHTNIKVAIKLESIDTKNPQLLQERKIYSSLLSGDGIPKMYEFGIWKKFNYIVMDLLGPSLEYLFDNCGRKFTLKTVLMIADQIIERIELLHAEKIVHREIEPSNFLIGVNKNSACKVYIIDFGMAQPYITQDGNHIQCQLGNKLIGSSRFPSINAHLGVTQGRRDDLESLGYMLLYFLKGSLPWQNLQLGEKYNKILEIKRSIEQLCQGLPQEFAIYLNYVRKLEFEDIPDYTYLKNLFKDLFKKNGFLNDNIFDWD